MVCDGQGGGRLSSGAPCPRTKGSLHRTPVPMYRRVRHTTGDSGGPAIWGQLVLFLMRHNLHSIKSTLFKCTVQWVLTKIPCNYYHNQDTEHFHHPRKFPCPLWCQYPSPIPTPQQPLIYFVTKILPFLDFQKNRIIQYVLFCIWLFTQYNVSEMDLYVVVLVVCSYLLVSSFPLYGHTTIF